MISLSRFHFPIESNVQTDCEEKNQLSIKDTYVKKQPPEVFCKKSCSQENTCVEFSFLIKLQASGV